MCLYDRNFIFVAMMVCVHVGDGESCYHNRDDDDCGVYCYDGGYGYDGGGYGYDGGRGGSRWRLKNYRSFLNEKTAGYSLFIALTEIKNTMKILPAIVYRLINGFLILKLV
jgi:hypothetical protein